MSTEEKLQEAAKEFADKNTQGCIPIIAQEKYNGFIIGAKSPESLEYWKEKEKLWTNQEVYNLFTEYFADVDNTSPTLNDGRMRTEPDADYLDWVVDCTITDPSIITG